MATGRVPTTANSPLTAKGDLFTYDTSQARLPVGNNGETLLADSAASQGLRWGGNYAAGKNKCINGDFSIWQRGTSFSNPVAATYTADRYNITYDGSGATRTISRQAFTAGSAPVAGYESEFFLRYERSVAGSGATFDIIRNNIEDVRTFAGQSVTVSFWAKADSGSPVITIAVQQVFGSGGSVAVRTDLGTATLSTSWARYTATATVPSISGKTLGAGNYFSVQLRTPVNTIQTFDFWGVQAEQGSVATAFQTATGTLALELAACQRYYIRLGGNVAYETLGVSYNVSTTAMKAIIALPVPMRVNPTSIESSTLCVQDTNDALSATLTSVVLADAGRQQVRIAATGTGLNDNSVGTLLTNNSTSGYIAFSAEL